MTDLKIYDPKQKMSPDEKDSIVNFLHTHLEKFRDSKEDIRKAIDYSLKEYTSFGGFVITSSHEGELTGAVVVNQTGMEGYIPENILVYIATHSKYRGKGIGKRLMQEAINLSVGNIALHVEPDNPAKYLYEKIGFTNKYLEMRLINQKK